MQYGHSYSTVNSTVYRVDKSVDRSCITLWKTHFSVYLYSTLERGRSRQERTPFRPIPYPVQLSTRDRGDSEAFYRVCNCYTVGELGERKILNICTGYDLSYCIATINPKYGLPRPSENGNSGANNSHSIKSPPVSVGF